MSSVQRPDVYPVWWSTGTKEPNMAAVLGVYPYKGRYTEYFNAVLRLAAPETKRGWLEMAVKL